MPTRTFTRAQLAEHHVPPDDPTDHDRPYYPSQIGVFCDDCGTEHAELAKVRTRLAEARSGASDRAIILDAARDALEVAGMAGVHGDDWPWVHLSIETLVAERDEARSERDRARDIAVALEQQLAAVTALHVYDAEAGYCEVCANHGDIEWPCATVRALTPRRTP
ncbi:MAG: hypothetical protein ACTHZ5_15970 [Micrococcaceae bacterium]